MFENLLNMLVPVLFGILFVVLENNAQVRTRFSCESRPSGYYADMETGCQVYHMCDGLGRQFSYSCPNATLFQQRMLVCDHWYMVNCSKSEEDYQANLLIGQRDKPFVEDSVKHPYHRTPRPDLLSRNVAEYNSIHRNGRAQFGTNLNLVGVETDSENSSVTTDLPFYSLPSHWFTEYAKDVTTKRTEEKNPNLKQYKFNKSNTDFSGAGVKKSVIDNKIKAKPVISQNVKTNFNEKPFEPSTEQPPVNFRSAYKNTTPVFPLAVEDSSKSDNLGTEPTVTQNPFAPNNPQVGPPSRYYQPPDFDEQYNSRIETSASVLNKNVNRQIETATEKLFDNKPFDNTEKKWKDLRQLFLIPDYEFPLDSVSRPSYDQGQSSFQVDQLPPDALKK